MITRPIPAAVAALSALAVLASCAPAPSVARTVALAYKREYKVVPVVRPARTTSVRVPIGPYTAHEYAILNRFDGARRILVRLVSAGGTVDARLSTDRPYQGANAAWELLDDAETKGVDVTNPTSERFYFYAVNRTAALATYTITIVAE